MFTWVLVLAIGIVIGIGLGVYFMRLDDEAKRTQQSLRQQLQASQTELQIYKAEVQQSYVTTAHLINNLTDSYKAVHQHLSHSAAALCGDVAAVNKLDLKDSSNQYLQQLQAPQAVEPKPTTQTSVEVAAPESAHAPHNAESGQTQAQEITRRSHAEPENVEPQAEPESVNEEHNASLAAPQAEEAPLADNHQAPLADNHQAPLADNHQAPLADNHQKTHAQNETPTSAASSDNATSARSDDGEHGHAQQDLSSHTTSAENSEGMSTAGVESQLSNHSRQHPRRSSGNEPPSAPMTPEEEEAFQEKLKLEQARVEASRMIH